MYIAICDDDIGIAEHLRDKLFKTAGQQVAKSGIFTDANSLLFAMETQQFDIIFMDVEFGEVSGIELSKQILSQHPDIQIIFVSGYDDYYLDVYDVEHVYFLKKPIDNEKLKAAFDTACKKLKDKDCNVLTLSGKTGLFRIALNDILYLEKNQRLILIHTTDMNIYKTYGKFTDISEQLTSFFVQCHVSYMVNFRHVTTMEKQEFHLDNGSIIPVSKSFYKKVKELFLIYLEREL